MIGSWSTSYDPQIYSTVRLDITKIEPFLNKQSETLKEKITLTIFVIKLMSLLITKYKNLNGYLRLGQYCPKEFGADICCLVADGDGKDLAKVTLKSCESKSLKEVAESLNEAAEKLRTLKNKKHNQKMSLVSLIPGL
jgi:pyruvate/2-oxoglutarate dehydrogenase complex dihydrolipoamide acyltransferase (E2) component